MFFFLINKILINCKTLSIEEFSKWIIDQFQSNLQRYCASKLTSPSWVKIVQDLAQCVFNNNNNNNILNYLYIIFNRMIKFKTHCILLLLNKSDLSLVSNGKPSRRLMSLSLKSIVSN